MVLLGHPHSASSRHEMLSVIGSTMSAEDDVLEVAHPPAAPMSCEHEVLSV